MTLLAFGEVLYDVFGEQKTIGGAPLNISYHFHKCGGEAGVISAVGDDELGRNAVDVMKRAGLSTEYISVSEYPTGRADVVMNGNEAGYEFNYPCAWDDINISSDLPKAVDVFYWGTLALRSGRSQETFRRISSAVNAKIRYFDVNIRKEFYSEAVIREGLELCNVLKVNENELPLILRLSGAENVEDLKKKYSVDIVILTEGEKGSTVYADEIIRVPAVKTDVVDTVGAGDSYSACFLYNYLSSGNVGLAAEKAALLSSFVCSKRGGMPEYSMVDTVNRG